MTHRPPRQPTADPIVTVEAHQLAARLAAASEVFPIVKADDWDSTARATAEGAVITVVVTDHMGRATREYRAVVQLVAETANGPRDSGVGAPDGGRRTQSIREELKGMTIMTHTPDPVLPVPAGATAGPWDSLNLDNIPCRSLEWSRHDTDKVGVGIDGFQDATGAVSRCISLYLSGQDLDAADARALAARLVDAAEALERLQ